MNGAGDDIQDLYRALILEHARAPRNFGRLDEATHTAEGINPLCGDKLRLYLCVDDEDRIVNLGFEGSGCAISVASASLLTETLCGSSVADARSCFDAVTHRLTAKSPGDDTTTGIDISALRALDGVRQHPSRVKCATLAWHALHAALEHSPITATTE